MNNYDDTYARHDNYFGSQPEPLLVTHTSRISADFPILDIGAGQGRHALFLAGHGHRVIAMDPSETALRTIQMKAAEQQVSVQTIRADVQTFETNQKFSAILLFGLIQILNRSDIERLIEKTRQWTVPGSHVFVTAFSTDEPALSDIRMTWREIGKNSFEQKGEIRTYLEPGEILDFFKGFDVVTHEEMIGPWHRHGNSPAEQHGVIRAVFIRSSTH